MNYHWTQLFYTDKINSLLTYNISTQRHGCCSGQIVFNAGQTHVICPGEVQHLCTVISCVYIHLTCVSIWKWSFHCVINLLNWICEPYLLWQVIKIVCPFRLIRQRGLKCDASWLPVSAPWILFSLKHYKLYIL